MPLHKNICFTLGPRRHQRHARVRVVVWLARSGRGECWRSNSMPKVGRSGEPSQQFVATAAASPATARWSTRLSASAWLSRASLCIRIREWHVEQEASYCNRTAIGASLDDTRRTIGTVRELLFGLTNGTHGTQRYTPEYILSAFARRRSGVRIPSAPVLYAGFLVRPYAALRQASNQIPHVLQP